MTGFHAILCMLFFQIVVVLSYIQIDTDAYCIYIHETTGSPQTDPAAESACPPNGFSTRKDSVKVEIFAGFPRGSTKPKWVQTFSLTRGGVYHFKKDYCLWHEDNTLIGCAKGCPNPADSFENPYEEYPSQELTNPTHGEAPPNVPENQKSEFANTCSASKTSYNFESQQPSLELASNAQTPGYTAVSTEPSDAQIESSQNTQPDQGLDASQPNPPPPSQQLYDISTVPDTYVPPNPDSTPGTLPLDNWGIFQRSVRKSPRDFRRGSG